MISMKDRRGDHIVGREYKWVDSNSHNRPDNLNSYTILSISKGEDDTEIYLARPNGSSFIRERRGFLKDFIEIASEEDLALKRMVVIISQLLMLSEEISIEELINNLLFELEI